MAEISFRKFTSTDAKAFKALNIEWLETYFVVEAIDELVLSNPQTEIIDKGALFLWPVSKKNGRYFCLYQKRRRNL